MSGCELMGFYTSVNPRTEGGNSDFMDGILPFIKKIQYISVWYMDKNIVRILNWNLKFKACKTR